MADEADMASQYTDWLTEEGIRRVRAQAAPAALAEHTHCSDCGAPLPAARRQCLPGVRTCVACQVLRERHRQLYSPER